MRVLLDLVTMVGHRYLLLEREGRPQFPSGEVAPGEAPAAAARRILSEWTGLANPKLEVLDMRPHGQDLQFVLRALFADPPTVPHTTAGRYELPAQVGRLAGPYVEEALKTSLSYKLTRTDSK